MESRSWSCVGLVLVSLLASGCPQPGGDGGDTWTAAETGETGSNGSSDTTGPSDSGGSGVEDGGDVRPPPIDMGDGGDSGDGDGEPSGVVDYEDRCWDRTWNGDTFPAVFFDNTIGRNDDFTGSCGLGAAPDFQLGFFAPWEGDFTFDTAGSSFDTVVYLNDGECGEQELGCNDDFIGLDSKLTVHLDKWQTVTVTVDGTGPFEQGPLVLTITEADPPTCNPAKILPNLPVQIVDETTFGTDELAGDCGGEGAPEQVYEFTAPGPGTYRFDTEGSSFDTVLYTLDACDGPPLLCSDDVDFQPYSELVVDMVGGQKLLIVVDGHDANDSGDFVFNVAKL